MRVAQVCPYDLDLPGGVQSHVLQLADALEQRGAEVTVIAPGTAPPAAAARRHVDVGSTLPVRFNDSVAPVALGPAAALRTRRALLDGRFDVVHVHEPMVPWTGLTAACSSRAPVVATFHAWSDRDRLYALARPLGRMLGRRLAARVAVSEAAAGYHARAMGWLPGSFRIVPNGVDVARFAEAEPFEDVAAGPEPSLLFVGRLERRKGLETLIRAFTRCKADRADLQLHVVGEGAQLERARGLLAPRLRADVHFHGRVPAEDVPRWFASCDVYVSPALGGESFGIVLLEAMAAGRAFVASDIPGYRSVASDGVQGWLVPRGDVPALAEAIGALLDNPALCAAMGAEGQRIAWGHDWATLAERLHALYAEVAATGQR